MKTDVEQLMAQVRAEVARRRAKKRLEPDVNKSPDSTSPLSFEVSSDASVTPLKLPRFAWQPPWNPKPRGYHVNDFLQFHDRDFVVNVYRGVLKREPDAGGLDNYLGQLRTGAQSKTEILGRIRYSGEGRAKSVRIRGLPIPLALEMLYKVPIAGGLIRTVTGIFRLPTIVHNVVHFHAHLMALDTQRQDQLNELSSKVEATITGQCTRQTRLKLREEELENKVTVLQEQIAEQGVNLETAVAQQIKSYKIGELRNTVTAFHNTLHQLQATNSGLLKEFAEVKRVVALQERCINFMLEEATKRLPEHTESKSLRELELEELENRLMVFREQGGEQLIKLQTAIANQIESVEVNEFRKCLATFNESLRHLEANSSHTMKKLVELKRQVVLQERRINLMLEEARKRLPAPFNGEQLKKLDNEYQHRLDAFYATFEDEFRGTHDDIKERARVYLPIVKSAHTGTQERPILDLGCGRGEWLELLGEEGLLGSGVDLNHVFVEQCTQAGLAVTQADMLSYLRGLRDNSLGAVTGFHIIEHFPFDTIVALFEECLRVLQPGGVAIYETPNPENIAVGACNFYFDPTHLRPLPPSLMHFMLEARGFINVAIQRLHPALPDPGFHTHFPEELQSLWNYFLKEQDYALIGYKP